MTEFECGCRIMTDVIRLNERGCNKPSWNYLLKTFVNVCGRCAHKQMKFQQMENMMMDVQRQRMDMFLNDIVSLTLNLKQIPKIELLNFNLKP